MNAKTPVGPDTRIELFSYPGHRSCLRAKEFLEKTGLAFDEVDVEVVPERVAELSQLGLSCPAVIVDRRGVSGLDFVSVAKIIGYEYEAPRMLDPRTLKDKYDLVMTVLCRLIAQVPPEGLEQKSPERDRSLRELAGHAGSVMRSFLHAYEDDTFSTSWNHPPAEVRTTEQLIAWANETDAIFDNWWEKSGIHDSLDRIIETFWGFPTLYELFERSVWETAQHTREVALALERFDIVPDRPLTEADMSGLPPPDGMVGHAPGPAFRSSTA